MNVVMVHLRWCGFSLRDYNLEHSFHVFFLFVHRKNDWKKNKMKKFSTPQKNVEDIFKGILSIQILTPVKWVKQLNRVLLRFAKSHISHYVSVHLKWRSGPMAATKENATSSHISWNSEIEKKKNDFFWLCEMAAIKSNELAAKARISRE